MNIRVLIVDDHAVVRHGLRAFLSLSDDLETVGEAADGDQAVELAHRLHPDLVLMDLLMPGSDGINATATIRRELPAVQVLALSGYLDDHLIADVLHAGAVGYLLKDTAAGDLHRAIRAAAAGQVQLSPEVAARLVRDVHLPGGPPRLTRREEEVIVLLARGRANGQIARELHITPQTVKTHVSNILSKLNSRSRTEAALHAMRVGLVPVHETGPADLPDGGFTR
jgi:DNA-binding NarL/FixJ family response regulator